MAVLIFRERDGSIRQEREFTFELRIGSAGENAFCLPAELKVSPYHAVIARSEPFQVPVLLDLADGTMPIRVNGRPVVQIKTLKHKDVIELGLARLEFWEVVIRAVTIRSPLVGKRCLVCYTDVRVGDEVVSCPRCQSPYHPDCWYYLATCAYYGCGYPVGDTLRRVLSPTMRFEKTDAGSELVKTMARCRAGNPRDQAPFKPDESVAYCPSCQTPFHAECWLALRQCPVCRYDVGRLIRGVLSPARPDSASEQEKTRVAEPLIEITDPGRDRYATLNLISWWNQERLRRARVMVVGVGALGNEVLKNLALLGIGRVFIADFDVVEASNLSRSILFRRQDSGRRKVEVAAERVREINPEVQVATFHGDVTRDLGLGVYRRMDIVFGCLDNRAARLVVNRACWRLGVPWIDGALDVLMGMVRVFVPPDSACYECTMTEQDYELMNLRYSCPLLRPEDLVQGRLPTTPTSASIVGALQVQEAIKLLHGLEVPAGRGIFFNGQNYRTSLIAYSRRADCYSHEAYAPIVELNAGVNDLTVGAFLELAEHHVGEGPALVPDQEIVRALHCPRCGANETIFRRFESVVPDHVPCPACGANRLPDVVTRLVHGPAAAAIPLRQIEIPEFHIVRVESVRGSSFFELSRDSGRVLKGWSPIDA